MTRWLAVLAVVVAACGSAQAPSPNPVELCAPPAEPRPADEPGPGGGDAIDGADFGSGSWRMCLVEPVAAAAENKAWCEWTPDRTAVIGISGLSVTIGSATYDSGLVLASKEFFLTGYEPGAVSPSLEATEDGRSGHVAFAMVPMIDPEHGAAPGLAPRVIGVMRWQCGDPPPPR